MVERIFRPALGVLRRLGVMAPPGGLVRRVAPPDLRDRAHREAVARRASVRTGFSFAEMLSAAEDLARIAPHATQADLERLAVEALARNTTPAVVASGLRVLAGPRPWEGEGDG